MLKLSRWCARAALLGGALSVVEGLLILSNPEYYGFDSPLELLILVVEGAALLATLGGLVGLHVRQSGSYGHSGVAGFLAVSAGTVLAGAGHLGAVPFFDFVNVGGMVYVLFALKEGFFLVGGMTYVLGVVVMSAGYLLLGAASARARTLPVWSGLALISGLAGLWAGNAVGWILFGLAWVVVGLTLRSGKGAQTSSTERAG
jgi:hypothetical protein